MRYTMIVSRAMFEFTYAAGRIRLKAVRFLADERVEEKNDVLLVRERERIDFYLSSSIPVSRLTREQYRFAAAVSRYFGYLNPKNIKVWVWSGCLELPSLAGSDLLPAAAA